MKHPLTDYLISRLNKLVPPCAVTWEPTRTGIRYLHPRKGWKPVGMRRLGIKRAAVSHP